MRHLLLLFLGILFCNTLFAQLYTFKNFSHKDGLSLADISCIYQSDDGLIWLGTDGAGLLNYNGYKFTEISISNSDNDHHVTSIIEVNDTIYFTSQFKGLISYKDGKYTTIVRHKTHLGIFLQVVQMGSYQIIVTTKGIFKRKNDQLIQLSKISDPTHSLEIRNVIQLKSGCILLTSKGNFHISEKIERVQQLNNWLHISKDAARFIEFGYYNGQSIFFYNRQLNKKIEVILNEKDAIFKINSVDVDSPLIPYTHVVAFYGTQGKKNTIALGSDNSIYRSTNTGFIKLAHNFNAPLEMCNHLIIDKNDDFWVTSSLKGLYKISSKPFTKIQLHPVYTSGSINTIFRSSSNDVIISSMEGYTNIGKLYNSDLQFRKYNFKTNSSAEYNNQVYLGTNHGINRYNSNTNTLEQNCIPELQNDKITLLYMHENILWVGVFGKGLLKYTLKDGIIKSSTQFDSKNHPHVYTAQITADQQTIYFGTNNGIVQFSLKTQKFSKIKTPKILGAYIGVSTRDVFGNLWFTGDKAILGILKNGENVILEDQKIFPSTLFYTLNSDNYGNLIIGTNKGITILTVNEFGEVLNHKSYQGDTGFDGYETHMRSQFQDNNSIFVGTVEGLYLINTSILQNLPPPNRPIIETTKINRRENALQFHFVVNNPKIKNVEYSYRIKGYQDNWSVFTKKDLFLFTDLPNGHFTIEVKATYDGIIFSEIGHETFIVNLPFWKSKWFIFILLLTLVSLNIILINRNRSFSSGDFFKTKDTVVPLTLTPTIILFALLANTSIQLLAPIIDTNIVINMGFSLATAFLLLILYLSALSAQKNNQTGFFKILLSTTFVIVMINNLFYCYYTNIQPYFVIAVVITNSICPFIFDRIKSLLIVSVIFILIGCLIVLATDNTVYNEMLFLMAIIVSVVLALFSSYLRYDSMEKLIFISGVINKGNIPAIAFNSEGIITYVSENIFNTIGETHESLIGKHISYLNMHVPEEGNYRKVDLTQNFEDGKKYLVPMLTKTSDLNWIEWSCKVFNENVKVILGQNVTDRLELENTYELLVQNAEDLIYQCDKEGNLRFLNNRCFDKLGYSMHELIGKNAIELVQEDYQTKVSEFYRTHFEKKAESSYLEFPIETKKGTVIWVGQYITTLYKAGDKKVPNGFLALARDITTNREQQEIIKEQRDDITSSINYAQKIQLNLLPSIDKFKQSFEEISIIYRPKDIVSGDFYWHERIEDVSIIALADCTGHGVPGSFMTLLGTNILNNLVLEQHIFNPGIILDELDKKLTYVLPRENGDENMNDGMEISLCVFDHKTGDMSYACAGSRFLIYEANAFTMYKGDTKHIGDKPIPEFKNYITHYMKFSPNSTLFLFTDGYQDQFGGIKNKKYSFRRMLELFESNIRLPLSEQQLMIEEEFDQWKSEFIQTDDVTIVAIRTLSVANKR